MSKFKKGDRVKLAGDCGNQPAGRLGTVQQPRDRGGYVGVLFDGDTKVKFWTSGSFDLAEPVRATDKE